MIHAFISQYFLSTYYVLEADRGRVRERERDQGAWRAECVAGRCLLGPAECHRDTHRAGSECQAPRAPHPSSSALGTLPGPGWGAQGSPSLAAPQECLRDPQGNSGLVGPDSGLAAAGSRAGAGAQRVWEPRWWTRVPRGPPPGLRLLSQPHTSFGKHTRPVIDSLPSPSQPSGPD